MSLRARATTPLNRPLGPSSFRMAATQWMGPRYRSTVVWPCRRTFTRSMGAQANTCEQNKLRVGPSKIPVSANQVFLPAPGRRSSQQQKPAQKRQVWLDHGHWTETEWGKLRHYCKSQRQWNWWCLSSAREMPCPWRIRAPDTMKE